jgi:hypothetical protein
MKIPSDWLTVRVENRPIPEHRDLPPMPALRIRREWEKLKAQVVEGDEVWAYAIVRKGKIIQSVVVTSA